MGREVRMVPKGWNHPVDMLGEPVALMKGPWSKAAREWDAESAAWQRGEMLDYSKWPKEHAFKPKTQSALDCETFEEWSGARPVQSEYMPEFPEGMATMLMMYENTSEGTPISPAFETPEELARWLADNNASAFGGMTATYEQWLSTCKSGWAPSAMVVGGHLMSGVEASEK